ncbi:hypothetical protein BD311DRAFT_192064 [Dichomitus squalens]|uniref:Uncharacterized protein n=1 Tax=Dichomitus squalens TaxID=114155 RepID=A0A4Q9M494_9APHY|nr:hypothetical protein BD311DRAFT_192064 [Dichomitus squalens]
MQPHPSTPALSRTGTPRGSLQGLSTQSCQTWLPVGDPKQSSSANPCHLVARDDPRTTAFQGPHIQNPEHRLNDIVRILARLGRHNAAVHSGSLSVPSHRSWPAWPLRRHMVSPGGSIETKLGGFLGFDARKNAEDLFLGCLGSLACQYCPTTIIAGCMPDNGTERGREFIHAVIVFAGNSHRGAWS